MKLLNLVIEKSQAHDVLKDIALKERIHLVDSITEINESNFKLKVDEDLIEEVKGLCLIDTFSEKRDYKTLQEKYVKIRNSITNKIKMAKTAYYRERYVAMEQYSTEKLVFITEILNRNVRPNGTPNSIEIDGNQISG